MADANRIAAALRYQQELDAAQRPATVNPNLAAQGLGSRNRLAAAPASQSPSWSGEALPMEGRATFLPFRDTLPGSVMNKREFALPGVVAGAMNAITAPRRAMQTEYEADEAGNITPKFNAPEEAMNVAGNLMGGGITIGRAPAGSLGMNVTREGRIPETASDVSKLADLLEKRAESAGIEMATDKSKISPSRYIEFTKPNGEPYKVRISNHLDVHGGNDISVDPHSMNTFEEAIALLKENGISIPDRKIIDRSLNNQANKAWLWSQFQGKEKPPYKLGSQEYREATDYANALYDKQKNGTLIKQDIDKFYAMHRDKSAEEK